MFKKDGDSMSEHREVRWSTGWIDVRDRLPDKECAKFHSVHGKNEEFEVIVMIAGGEIATGLIYDMQTKTFEDESGERYPVTHWMEFPAPPMKSD